MKGFVRLKAVFSTRIVKFSSNYSIMSVLSPKESGEFIVNHGKHVKVVEAGVEKCASEIFDAVRSGKLTPRNFGQSGLHPKCTDEKAIDWIFLVDTLNFSFWVEEKETDLGNPTPHWEVSYQGKNHSGYFALCAGVNRAIDEGIDLTNPAVYGSLTEDDILKIFRSETSSSIPLVQDRVKNLKEASQTLLQKYEGSFSNCVKACKNRSQDLLKIIVTDFPSYRDEADFNGKRVSLYKRAQILIGDIWACYEGKGLGAFEDIDTLTMFADYRVPQVLQHYGALVYSPELLEFLWKNNLLPNGDSREVEIRGASIHAVELVKEKVRKRLIEAGLPSSSINSILIDHFLWDYRRANVEAMDKYPYHKTRCIYY